VDDGAAASAGAEGEVNTVAALHWSDGMHLGHDSSVTYQAEPDNKHGEYRIRRSEGGCTLSYTQWRDANGGAVALVTQTLGTYPSVQAAKKAAGQHNAERARYKAPLDAEHVRLERLAKRAASESLSDRAAAERSERRARRYGGVRPYGKRDV
jgi:hypothetical protein